MRAPAAAAANHSVGCCTMAYICLENLLSISFRPLVSSLSMLHIIELMSSPSGGGEEFSALARFALSRACRAARCLFFSFCRLSRILARSLACCWRSASAVCSSKFSSSSGVSILFSLITSSTTFICFRSIPLSICWFLLFKEASNLSSFVAFSSSRFRSILLISSSIIPLSLHSLIFCLRLFFSFSCIARRCLAASSSSAFLAFSKSKACCLCNSSSSLKSSPPSSASPPPPPSSPSPSPLSTAARLSPLSSLFMFR
mmetsp:Transcript_14487/g.26805  ORF Transcript_14487/g.26805 Transcript_14487/m.26805 type:complete len:258 (-) Transcript_14487:1175-1948(-)